MGWCGWEDDGSVALTWNRPGPDLANSAYVEAYLEHLRFWIDKGIVGWDADALPTWTNLNLEAVRSIRQLVIDRGGFIASELGSLEHDIIRCGGFNAGTGKNRTALYRELEAMVENDADYIRPGLATRRQLIELGMLPFQQFGEDMYERYTGLNHPFKLQMF